MASTASGRLLGRFTLAAAVLLYASAVAVSLLTPRPTSADPSPGPLPAPSPDGTAGPTTSPATSAISPFDPIGLPYRGAGMQIQRLDWIDRYEKSIDEIAAIGGDTVLLVIDTRQENGASNRVYLDMRITPSPQQLGGLILHAREKGLRVIVMPIVLLDDPRGNEWRGTIKPASWDEWWQSYEAMIMHFAHISQGYGAHALVVGSELVSTEHMEEQWEKLIADVREVYTGKLTYSSNWDHYIAIPFWDQLDLIGMNSYWKMGPNRRVTTDKVVERWREIQKDVLAFQQRVGKPLVLLEVGWCSLENAAHEPWDYTRTTLEIDLDLQKRLYEAFFQAWHGNPALGGFMIWEWTPEDGIPNNRGYTPEQKPAEAVLREWLAKPRWQVGTQ